MHAIYNWIERQDRRHIFGVAMLAIIGAMVYANGGLSTESLIWTVCLLAPFFVPRKLIWLGLVGWSIHFAYWAVISQKGAPYVNLGLWFGVLCMLVAAAMSYRKENPARAHVSD